MITWFEDCHTVEEIQSKYHKLAKRYHPDLGGDTRTMQDINVAYENACKYYVRYNNPERTQRYYSWSDTVNENIRLIISQLVKLQGITVEVCGWWIWVGGNTRAVKEQLKILGLRFSGKKQMWYYAGVPANSHRRYSMDEIRSMYGSNVVKDDESVI